VYDKNVRCTVLRAYLVTYARVRDVYVDRRCLIVLRVSTLANEGPLKAVYSKGKPFAPRLKKKGKEDSENTLENSARHGVHICYIKTDAIVQATKRKIEMSQ